MPTPALSREQAQAAVDALAEHGNQTAAALAMGLARSTFQSRLEIAARYGLAPGHFNSGAAPGFAIGKVTIQRNAFGEVERTWERQLPEQARAAQILEAACEAVVASSRSALPPVRVPTNCDDDLLTVIPMGDPHFGLLTWAAQCGENFDLKIAEHLTFEAVDRLTGTTPASRTALLLNLGDFFHADDSTNKTRRSSAELDVDGRFEKIALVGIMAMVRCIQRLLEKHERVIVRNNRGNHDPHQATMLGIALMAWFHAEPRVTVNTSPSSFFYHRFGKVLIGSTHGDGAKLGDLPLIMATDSPDDWAASKFRVWHCGHFHHDQLKEHPGCTVETHRTLAPNDAWHRHEGYRSGRDMKAVIYHREHGEITRIRCGISQLEAA